MIFYVAEAALLFLLALAIALLAAMYRELGRQNRFRQEFGQLLVETSSALEGIDRTLRGFDQRSDQTLDRLGARISQARDAIDELERLSPLLDERPAQSKARRPACETGLSHREEH